MSLAESLRGAIRTRLPDELFKEVLLQDKSVVENILLVLAEYTSVDISRSQLEKVDGGYSVTVPISGDSEINLSDLRNVESYSPARVIDLRVQMKANRNNIKLIIADENRKVMVAECDVVRVRKRRRWFSWGSE